MITPSSKPDFVRRISPQTDQYQLLEDLKRLDDKARLLGASETAILTPRQLVMASPGTLQHDYDGSYPSIHWPLQYPKDDLIPALQAYQKGLLIRFDTPPGMPDYGGGPIVDPVHRALYERVYEAVTILESTAFYMGHHLVLGFAAGNCRSVFCHQETRCWAMFKGKVCIKPYQGRPSMDSIGLDASAMAAGLGWTVRENEPLLAGLIMVS